MTREELLAAIKECAEKLGQAPSFFELNRTMKISRRNIQRYFSTYREALKAVGMERTGGGYKKDTQALLLDWAALVRKLGKVPSMAEYGLHGKHSVSAVVKRFGSWSNIPSAMLAYARKPGLEAGWEDVLTTVTEHLESGSGSSRYNRPAIGTAIVPRIQPDKPVYGPPFLPLPLAYAPTNEMGVMFLFAAMARDLGFSMLHVQAAFPDGEAMREIEPGRWQRVRIEFEYESKNFLAHLHPVSGCEVIVCWENNWPECPLEVIELKSLMPKLASNL